MTDTQTADPLRILREVDAVATAEVIRRDGSATLGRRASMVGVDASNWTRSLSGARPAGWHYVIEAIRNWNRDPTRPRLEMVVSTTVELRVGAPCVEL